jgi:hypothetical protein
MIRHRTQADVYIGQNAFDVLRYSDIDSSGFNHRLAHKPVDPLGSLASDVEIVVRQNDLSSLAPTRHIIGCGRALTTSP